jgi:hypothetical protein
LIDSSAVPLLGANLLLFAGLNSRCSSLRGRIRRQRILADDDIVIYAAADGTAPGMKSSRPQQSGISSPRSS